MIVFIPPNADGTYPRPPLKVWWIIWVFLLVDLLGIYAVLGQGPLLPAPSGGNPLTNLVGFVPLFISIIIRWLVLPRSAEPMRAFVLFVVGIALAESCGLLGIFLGGPYRDSLFVLGVLGVTQYVPFYAKKLFDPKGSGFIPNN
ncbi:MAG: hypothetical protein HYX71_04920 [Opitutae bacterium]|nr:hypothetical protein [Opitutae bacterium]